VEVKSDRRGDRLGDSKRVSLAAQPQLETSFDSADYCSFWAAG